MSPAEERNAESEPKPPAKAPCKTFGGFYEETDHFRPSGIGQEEEETLP